MGTSEAEISNVTRIDTPQQLATRARDLIRSLTIVMNKASKQGVNVNFTINKDEGGQYKETVTITKVETL